MNKSHEGIVPIDRRSDNAARAQGGRYWCQAPHGSLCRMMNPPHRAAPGEQFCSAHLAWRASLSQISRLLSDAFTGIDQVARGLPIAYRNR